MMGGLPMKELIKELKKEALEKLGEQENPQPWFNPREVLTLIAEIESLETKNQELKDMLTPSRDRFCE